MGNIWIGNAAVDASSMFVPSKTTVDDILEQVSTSAFVKIHIVDGY
jgi:hypothetical protein